MGKNVRARVIIKGLVQGVYFRAHAQAIARKNNVKGWVRNNPGGKVEAVLEGDEKAVERVIQWCRTGPPKAQVSGVTVSREEPTGEFRDFEVEYGRH